LKFFGIGWNHCFFRRGIMDVFVDHFGQFLGRTSERLAIRQKGKVISEIPFFQIGQIFVIGEGISLSSDLVQECAQRGISIYFLSASGTPLAQIFSPNHLGTVRTKREQLLAIYDWRGLEISLQFIEGKIRNQISTLKYCRSSFNCFFQQGWKSGLGRRKNFPKITPGTCKVIF